MTSELLARLDGPAAARLLVVLGHFCWQGAAVWAVAVLLASRVRSVRGRYRAELAAFGALCLCPVVTWFAVGPAAVAFDSPAAADAAVPPASDAVFSEAFGRVGAPAPAPAPVERAEVADVRVLAEPSVRGPLRWRAWALGFYVIGVLAGAVRLLCGAAGVALLKRSLRPAPAELRTRCAAIAAKLGLRRAVRAGFSGRTRSPCVAGWLRPAVVLPLSWCGRVPPDVLDAALAHELAHLRAGDLWVNLLQRLAETALFFHPAVWLLSARVRAGREACRDADAAAALGDPAAVARALEFAAADILELPPSRPARRPRVFSLPFGDGPMPLLTRVNGLLGRPPVRRSPASSALPAAAVLALPLAWWAGAAWAGPPELRASDVPPAAVGERSDGEGAAAGKSESAPREGRSQFATAVRVTPASVPLAGRPDGAVPVVREAGFVSPLAGSGPGAWQGVESFFDSAGRWAVIENGPVVSAWQGVSSVDFRDALTEEERAAVAEHIRQVGEEDILRLFAALIRYLEGTDGAEPPPTWSPRRGGDAETSPTQQEAAAYATAVSARSGGWLLMPYYSGHDLHIWKRVETSAVPASVSAGIFDDVIAGAAVGVQLPRAVLDFCEAAGVPNVSFRAAAAHPRGFKVGRRDFAEDERFDASAGDGSVLLEDTGSIFRAWSPGPLRGDRRGLSDQARTELTADLQRAVRDMSSAAVNAAIKALAEKAGPPANPEPPDSPDRLTVTTADGQWQVRWRDGRWALLRGEPRGPGSSVDLLSGDAAEEAFERIVLTRSRGGELVPAHVLQFFERRVENAAIRVAAAIRPRD